MENVSKQLARTNHTKYATYCGDGYGRDSYIIHGNGGLRNVDAPAVNIITGYQGLAKGARMYTSKNPQYKKVVGSKETTVHKYFGDGTGRDGYVIADCGGLIPKYVNKGVERNF